MRSSEYSSERLSEVEIVQNPALGAYLLWQYGLSFQAPSSSKSPIQFAFLVLPLTFHEPTLKLIKSTQVNSGLSMFAAKLAQQREDLLAVHERALVFRELSLSSLGLAASLQLVTIEYGTGFVRANSTVETPKLTLSPKLRLMQKGAEKLGRWFSEVDYRQVSTSLLVDF